VYINSDQVFVVHQRLLLTVQTRVNTEKNVSK